MEIMLSRLSSDEVFTCHVGLVDCLLSKKNAEVGTVCAEVLVPGKHAKPIV